MTRGAQAPDSREGRATERAPASDVAPLRLVHHHPGRLRLRSDALCRGGARAEAARRALNATPGVLFVGHDEETGSILVEYEPGSVAPDAIIGQAARATGLRFADVPENPRTALGERILRTARDANAVVYELTGGRADLRTLVPLALAGLSVGVLATKGDRLPRWDNLAYWSFNLFALLHVREINTMVPKPEPSAGRTAR